MNCTLNCFFFLSKKRSIMREGGIGLREGDKQLNTKEKLHSLRRFKEALDISTIELKRVGLKLE